MKKLSIILSVLAIVLLTGCEEQREGRAPANYGNTEDYELPNVTEVSKPDKSVGYNYLIDNNTGVVYLKYYGLNKYAITVMFNADGTVMTEKDIKK